MAWRENRIMCKLVAVQLTYQANKMMCKLETSEDFDKATSRYEEIKRAAKGTEEHKEKLLLVHLISEYEKMNFRDYPELDPIELIKIRMEDFGKKPADLAKESGD